MKKIIILILMTVLCLFTVQAALTDSINLYWNLDDDGGDAEAGAVADSAGIKQARRESVTLVNGTGIINTGYMFSAGHYFTNETTTVNAEFTVNWWARPTVLDGSANTMIDLGDLLISVDGLNITGVNTQGGGGPSGTHKLSLDTYQMITITQNSTHLNFYMNGSFDVSRTPEDAPSSDPTYVGIFDGVGQAYTGQLDEIGIWDRVLTASEIGELYNSGSGLAYPFNQKPEVNITMAFDPVSAITYPTQVNVSCITDSDGTPGLFRNDTNVTTENNIFITLGQGAYDYECNVTATDTFRPNSTSDTYIVNKNSGQCNVLFNETSPLSFGLNFKVFTDCNSGYTLTRDGDSIANNSVQSLGQGSYEYIVTRNDTGNYTNLGDTETFIIVSAANPAIPQIDSITDANINVTNIITMFCSSVNVTATINYQFYNTNDSAIKQGYGTNNNYTVVVADAHDIIEARCIGIVGGENSSVNATNISIQNTIPTTPSVVFTPNPANYTQTITAVGSSTDVDGDTITYTYKFNDTNGSLILDYSSVDNIQFNISFDAHTINIFSIANDGFGDSSTGTTSLLVRSFIVVAPPNFGSTVGYSDLVSGNPLLGVYKMYDSLNNPTTKFTGFLVLFLFVVFQVLLYIKTRSLTAMFVTGLLFASMASLYSIVRVTSIQVMFILLVLEFAGIVVMMFMRNK